MRRTVLVSVPALVVLLGAAACSGASAPNRAGAPTTATSSPSAVAPSAVAPSAVAPSAVVPVGVASTPVPVPPASASGSSASRTSARSSSTAPRTSATSTRPSPSPTSTAPAGLTVVLNPGHNGGNAAHATEIGRQVYAGYGEYKACDTTGTETNAGYSEHAFNWSVSQSVASILRARGITVIMTRPDDTGVGPCVDRRAAIGNHSYVAAVVSIHADGAPSSGHGFHVNQADRRPEGATAAVAADSDRLGRDIHAALVSSSGLVPSTYIGQDGYYYRSDLAGLDLASRPATFLELGNMRNAGDAALQSSAAGRSKIATAVANGILAYLGR